MPPFKLNPPPVDLLPGSQIYAYLRDSGHETQELSTQQQKNSLSEWASQYGLVIARFYIDEARRGSTTGRDQLQELMHDLRHAAPVKAVVVWSYNRFSRGLDDPVLYRAEVRTLGYTFLSLTDDVPEGPIGRIVEAVIDYKNFQYLKDLSIDIRRGQRELVSQYGCIPGTPPAGFKRTPVTLGHRRDGTAHIAHRWDPDPETAPLVLKAFQMRAAGAPLLDIMRATGIYNSLSSFVSFWPNKLYIGTLEFSDLVIENYCPPVVPLDLWQAVQEHQARFKKSQHVYSEMDHPRRAHSRYVLSGLLSCAQCGAPVNGNTSTSRGKRAIDTYACANLRKHTCHTRRIPREQLESAVISALAELILDPDIAAARQELDAQAYAVDHAASADQRKSIHQRLSKLRTQIRNITSAIKNHGHSAALLSALAELEHQEIALQSELEQSSRIPVSMPRLSLAQLAAQASAATNLLQNGSLEEKRAVLRGLIYKIKVENIDKQIKGIIFFYSPTHIQTEHPPPGDASIVRLPPGAPRYIHNIEFSVPYKKTRSK